MVITIVVNYYPIWYTLYMRTYSVSGGLNDITQRNFTQQIPVLTMCNALHAIKNFIFDSPQNKNALDEFGGK